MVVEWGSCGSSKGEENKKPS